MFFQKLVSRSRQSLMAGLIFGMTGFNATAANKPAYNRLLLMKNVTLTSHTFRSSRMTTRYWEAGPKNGPLIFFVHGWPEIGLTWRAQVEALAAEGWRCIAPDLRGFGDSSVPHGKGAYSIQAVVEDLVALDTHLGGKAAVWVGHDWGSPIVSSLVAHHPKISRGLVLVSVPYLPNGWALPNLIPFIDRKLYPANKYPDGQWDYWRFYLTHFDQAVSDMDVDVSSTLATIFTKGKPSSVGKLSPSAVVTANGGRFGTTHRAPVTKPDPNLWPKADFDVLVASFKKTGFRPADSYYLNNDANIAYAKTALNSGNLNLPVLYINDLYEPFSNIKASKIGDPMQHACRDLTVIHQPSGHWVTLERKAELSRDIISWLRSKNLR